MATSKRKDKYAHLKQSDLDVKKTEVEEWEVNPSKFVAGVTVEKMEADPVLYDFMKSNFAKVIVEEMSEEDKATIRAFEEAHGDEDEMEEVDVGPKEGIQIVKEQTEEQKRRNIRLLRCYKRDPVEEEGTRRCASLRANLMIPGLLYGGDPAQGILGSDRHKDIFIKTPWHLIEREIAKYNHAFEGRVYDLTIYDGPDDFEGTVHRVVPRNVQRHPVQGMIYCCNFVRYHPRRPLKLPMEFINEDESLALKAGAFIVPRDKFLECSVDEGVPIPEVLRVDCAEVKVREVIRLSRIMLPDGVKPRPNFSEKDFVVGTVFGRRRDEDEDEEGEEGGDDEDED